LLAPMHAHMKSPPGLSCIHLWVVFGVSCVQSDRLQVQSTVEVHGSHDVPLIAR
jgi:hypothetical protein